MTTTVGTERSAVDLVQNLLHLEHDAIAAYDGTIDRLDDHGAKEQISEFRSDHYRHVEELKAMAERMNVHAPAEGDAKQMLTTGKVALAGIAGDGSIVKAMKTNEDDTVQAYEQASSNEVADPQMREMFSTALADERRHRAWMQSYAERG